MIKRFEFDLDNNDMLRSLKKSFDEDGVIIVQNLIQTDLINKIKSKIREDFYNFIKNKEWIGGGLVIGHINATPPLIDKFIFENILTNKVLHKITSYIFDAKTINLDYSANINLPKSTRQLFHSDDSTNRHDIIMISIPLGDVNEVNGSTEFIPKTQYEQFNTKKITLLESKRANTTNGSVIIWRPSVWHRGTYNHSSEPRIMINLKHAIVGSKIHLSTPPILLNKNCIEKLGISQSNINYKKSNKNDTKTIFSKNYFQNGIVGFLKEIVFKHFIRLYDKTQRKI